MSLKIVKSILIFFAISLSLSCSGSLKVDNDNGPIFTSEDIKKIAAIYAEKKQIDLHEYSIPKIEFYSDIKYWRAFYRAKPIIINDKEYFGIDDCFTIWVQDGKYEVIRFKACP